MADIFFEDDEKWVKNKAKYYVSFGQKWRK